MQERVLEHTQAARVAHHHTLRAGLTTISGGCYQVRERVALTCLVVNNFVQPFVSRSVTVTLKSWKVLCPGNTIVTHVSLHPHYNSQFLAAAEEDPVEAQEQADCRLCPVLPGLRRRTLRATRQSGRAQSRAPSRLRRRAVHMLC